MFSDFAWEHWRTQVGEFYFSSKYLSLMENNMFKDDHNNRTWDNHLNQKHGDRERERARTSTAMITFVHLISVFLEFYHQFISVDDVDCFHDDVIFPVLFEDSKLSTYRSRSMLVKPHIRLDRFYLAISSALVQRNASSKSTKSAASTGGKRFSSPHSKH